MDSQQEKALLKSIQRTVDKMPNGYWLFAASGTLWLMRPDKDGNRAIVPVNGSSGGQMDQNYCVGEIKCSCDGGDW